MSLRSRTRTSGPSLDRLQSTRWRSADCGGSPTDTTGPEAARQLANVMLSPGMQTSCVHEIGGFPGIDWSYLPVALKAEYTDVIRVSIPTFPSGDWVIEQFVAPSPRISFDRAGRPPAIEASSCLGERTLISTSLFDLEVRRVAAETQFGNLSPDPFQPNRGQLRQVAEP